MFYHHEVVILNYQSRDSCYIQPYYIYEIHGIQPQQK